MEVKEISLPEISCRSSKREHKTGKKREKNGVKRAARDGFGAAPDSETLAPFAV
jgi:hypothetical protein